jgi:hypothetical protein
VQVQTLSQHQDGEVPSGTRSGIKKVVHELPWGWLHHSKPVTLCVTTLRDTIIATALYVLENSNSIAGELQCLLFREAFLVLVGTPPTSYIYDY